VVLFGWDCLCYQWLRKRTANQSAEPLVGAVFSAGNSKIFPGFAFPFDFIANMSRTCREEYGATAGRHA